MSSNKGEHQTVPLSVLLKREVANEKIERPEIISGQANQSKKGEDFTLIKSECQRVLGDGVTTYSVFGVLDGHNGSAAAIYTKENLLNNVLGAIPPDLNRDEWIAVLPRALVAGFVKTDKDFQEKGQLSGTTVTFVIIEGFVVTVASVGDSRCILESVDGSLHYLSADHRFEDNEEETERVTASGGEVGRLNTGGGTQIGPLRCWPGGLCLSRSIGDLDVGEFIVPVPYVKQVKLSSAGGRLIIASDGVWDALSAEAALDCCRGMPPDAAAAQVVKEAVQPKGLRDDTTCMVVDILPTDKTNPPVPQPKKMTKGVFKVKFIFKKKSSGSTSNMDDEYLEPDVVEEMVEEGSALLSERLDTKYPLCNMFKLFTCAVCQVEMKPGEGISVHAGSSSGRNSRPWDGPFLCVSCQEKREAMEGKNHSRNGRYSSGSE
ncbi:probable protein phosphatase 2C 12 [Cynara cardunculus var. scolymus]|uniref:probable protein phosphatase 2C 12 n=1 Tax=Cynara cardunculus var. scolymus TaxID=59895 RepID=UPI000D62EC58|nr:probable protein phosphatase 2C 12 [Cynara cardunculus var. scolymus]